MQGKVTSTSSWKQLRQGGDHGQYGHQQASAWPDGRHKWAALGVWTGVQLDGDTILFPSHAALWAQQASFYSPWGPPLYRDQGHRTTPRLGHQKPKNAEKGPKGTPSQTPPVIEVSLLHK